MPSKYYQRNFIPGSYYHIYNRGANKHDVFHDNEDYQTFIDTLAYYLKFPNGMPLSKTTDHPQKRKVPNLPFRPYSLVAYCLMPNHFHLMVKQIDQGPTISNLMKRLITTYAMYYQNKYDHSGVLLQGKFKNLLVISPEQWFYLTKYIHRNPITTKTEGSEPSEKLRQYPYSSYQTYLNPSDEQHQWIDSADVLDNFSKTNPHLTYSAFVEDSMPSGSLEGLTID